MAEAPPPVARTSLGLRNALFDEIDSLRRGETEAKRAHAVARIATEIINTVKMEMEVADYMQLKKQQSTRRQIAPIDFTSDIMPEAEAAE
ncbi:MAG TPA: hypothetical protein VLN57_13490 [Xanthobacteraceae bacterium]|nr:hypothetical protein [Xanthobacteraceae bacterium]